MSAAYNRRPEMDEILEAQLRRSLQPVKPNQEFVNKLQTRLAEPVTMTVERRSTAGLSLLLVAFSLLSGLLLIWGMRRLRPSGV